MICKKTISNSLEPLGQICSIGNICIEDRFISRIEIETNQGTLYANRLSEFQAPAIYDFYQKGLDEKSRLLFSPYPLFNTPLESVAELKRRLEEWKKEKNWTILGLFDKDLIIGIGMLKRFDSHQVSSGLVVRGTYRRMGMGCLIQSLINAQARLLGLNRIKAKVVSDNIPSIRIHKKYGFKKTGTSSLNVYKVLEAYLRREDERLGRVVDRRLVEMALEISDV